MALIERRRPAVARSDRRARSGGRNLDGRAAEAPDAPAGQPAARVRHGTAGVHARVGGSAWVNTLIITRRPACGAPVYPFVTIWYVGSILVAVSPRGRALSRRRLRARVTRVLRSLDRSAPRRGGVQRFTLRHPAMRVATTDRSAPSAVATDLGLCAVAPDLRHRREKRRRQRIVDRLDLDRIVHDGYLPAKS